MAASKGWKADEPHSRADRRRLLGKCGDECFLDPANGKYPICGDDCAVDCAGLAAARTRAAQYGHTQIKNEAIARALRTGCAWAAAVKAQAKPASAAPKKKKQPAKARAASKSVKKSAKARPATKSVKKSAKKTKSVRRRRA